MDAETGNPYYEDTSYLAGEPAKAFANVDTVDADSANANTAEVDASAGAMAGTSCEDTVGSDVGGISQKKSRVQKQYTKKK